MSERPPNLDSPGGQRYRTPPPARQPRAPLPQERRRRLVNRAAPLIAISAGAFLVGAVAGASGGGSEAAERFAKAWERQDFTAMHAELSPGAQSEFPVEAFTKAYVDAQATATATSVVTGESSETSADGGDAESFQTTVETKAFGEVTGTVELPLSGDGLIEWAPHLVFPGLEAGETLDRDTQVGERAPLLATDGTPLAEGPASARTSTLGASALAIAGAMGSPSRKQDEELFAAGFPRGTLSGTSGLELAFNSQLAGQPGGQLFATGGSENQRPIASSEPQPGTPVKTTIDPEIQTAAVTALGDGYGGVAVLDAKSGDVRALAGLAFSAPQPPGSTFKVVTAVAGLDSGAVKLDDEFPIESSNSLIGREISNAHDELCGGTFVESFAESCNTVFAPLGVEVGAEKMTETAEAFGFNQAPLLAAPDALEALEPPPSTYPAPESDVALGESAIGQGQVLATPLQMASVAQTIANQGTRSPTSLVKDDDLRPDSEPIEVTSAETASKLKDMMIEVVRSGTGTPAQIPGFAIAAKTGTAELGPAPLAPGQVLAPGEDPPLEENAWFTSYAPVDKPKLAVAVALFDADGGGGSVAGPIAREIYLSTIVGK